MKVTRFYLWNVGACKHDRRLFKKTFGWSAELTDENFKKAREVGLQTSYFTSFLAKGEVREQMLKLENTYFNRNYY